MKKKLPERPLDKEGLADEPEEDPAGGAEAVSDEDLPKGKDSRNAIFSFEPRAIGASGPGISSWGLAKESPNPSWATSSGEPSSRNLREKVSSRTNEERRPRTATTAPGFS